MKRLIYLFAFVVGLFFMSSCSSQDALEEITIDAPKTQRSETTPVKEHEPQDSQEVKKDKSPF